MNLGAIPAPWRLSVFLCWACALPGCGPSPDDPLPPLSGDLYAYSLAVAEKAKLKVPGDRVRPLYIIGRVHERFGLEDKALAFYDKALAQDPEFAEAYRRKGFILSQRKDRMPEAIEAYQQAIRCAPSFPGVFTRIGLVLIHLKRPAEAVQSLQEEIRSGKASEETYYNLGEAFFMQDKYNEAVAAYREAIQRSPEMREAHYGLANSLRALGDQEGHGKELARFQELRKRDEEREQAAEAKKDNRREQLAFASEAWSDAADAYLEEYQRTQEAATRRIFLGEAIAALRSAVEIAPTRLEAHKLLIDIHRRHENTPAAAAACEAALKALPEEPSLMYLLAALNIDLAERGSEREKAYLERALTLLERVLAAAPDLAEAHHDLASLILGRFQERSDLLPEALRHARLAAEKKSNPRNYDVLAWAYFRNGNVDLAGSALEEGLKHFPDDAELRQRLKSFSERKP